MKTNSIIKLDFDKAVSVPWSTSTCLIAQAAIRLFGSTGRQYDIAAPYKLENKKTAADRAMDTFDKYYPYPNARADNIGLKSLPKENRLALEKLRA